MKLDLVALPDWRMPGRIGCDWNSHIRGCWLTWPTIFVCSYRFAFVTQGASFLLSLFHFVVGFLPCNHGAGIWTLRIRYIYGGIIWDGHWRKADDMGKTAAAIPTFLDHSCG